MRRRSRSIKNRSGAYNQIGWCKLQIGGTVDEATRFIEQAIRLSPRDPRTFLWYFGSVRWTCFEAGPTTGLPGWIKRGSPTLVCRISTALSPQRMP
jgi:hypothetical protein